MTSSRAERWRVGEHYGIHVYAGDTPVATFHRPEDAARAVAAVNAALSAADERQHRSDGDCWCGPTNVGDDAWEHR